MCDWRLTGGEGGSEKYGLEGGYRRPQQLGSTYTKTMP